MSKLSSSAPLHPKGWWALVELGDSSERPVFYYPEVAQDEPQETYWNLGCECAYDDQFKRSSNIPSQNSSKINKHHRNI